MDHAQFHASNGNMNVVRTNAVVGKNAGFAKLIIFGENRERPQLQQRLRPAKEKPGSARRP